jgi:hypothetical protein
MTIANDKTQSSYYPQEQFWAKLAQFKFDLILYSYHFSTCVTVLRWSRIGTAVITVATTGVWIQWKNAPFINIICPIIILILQAINAGVEFLPYDSRKHELRELIDSLEQLYNKMEQDWNLIVLGELTIEQINEKGFNYQEQRTQIAKIFFKNDVLPNCKRKKNRAIEEANRYMSSLG